MHATADAWGGCPKWAHWAPLTPSCLQETASACLDFLFSLQALTNNSKKASTKPKQLSMCFTANHCHSALCPRTYADTVLAMPHKAVRNMLNVKLKRKLRSHLLGAQHFLPALSLWFLGTKGSEPCPKTPGHAPLQVQVQIAATSR